MARFVFSPMPPAFCSPRRFSWILPQHCHLSLALGTIMMVLGGACSTDKSGTPGDAEGAEVEGLDGLDLDTPDGDAETDTPIEFAEPEAPEGFSQAPLGPLYIEVQSRPPVLRVTGHGSGGDTPPLLESLPGVLSLTAVDHAFKWHQGFYGATDTVTSRLDFADGSAGLGTNPDGSLEITLADATGEIRVRIRVTNSGPGTAADGTSPEPTGLQFTVLPEMGDGGVPPPWNRVFWRWRCQDHDRFYGMGSQSDATEFRGKFVAVRTGEQGLGKKLDLAEGEAKAVAHRYEAYAPFPYALVARPHAPPQPQVAFGVVADTVERSRWFFCAEPGPYSPTPERPDPTVFEIHTYLSREILKPEGGREQSPSPEARLRIVAGPTPKDVVRHFTDLYGRARPVPRFAFGPWVAFSTDKGDPQEVRDGADALLTHGIAATGIWYQDYREYDEPQLPGVARYTRQRGIRLFTYWNTFLREGTPELQIGIDDGHVPLTPAGQPYIFPFLQTRASIVDLSGPKGWKALGDRLRAAWDTGVDGWMADYAEWINDDMRMADGTTGEHYANRSPLDWARLNRDIIEEKGRLNDGLYFSRSAYLHANRFLSVFWAGDQSTDFDKLDGLPTVIPIGLNMGFAGVSVYAHDIGGYFNVASIGSDQELWRRWIPLGALSPVMRTHRGLNYPDNWDWDSDEATIADFRRWTAFHLRLNPYLSALHRTAMRTGVPIMRHVVLEHPDWPPAHEAHYEYYLGPSLFVAPIVNKGTTSRWVRLPMSKYFRWETAEPVFAVEPIEVSAPLGEIPLFIRGGGIVPMLPEGVLSLETPESPAAPGTAQRPVGIEAEATRLTLVVAPGGPGHEEPITLDDGTVLRWSTQWDVSPDAQVRTGENPTADLPECPDAAAPPSATCVKWEADRRMAILSRTGPGRIIFGNALIQMFIPIALEIEGGPANRVYEIRAYVSHR